ncbi:MAG: aminotransferase class I/II-fold pyridoxal phosphate-dependent enzyme [Planctomycetes bacterium]|nr:aminotransferase class I/II-fold pyridoxal phosphate-dependent enzyme [Planctomycetota bacterium]
MPTETLADFRSDTVTRPTPEMYEAMARAELGDDVLGDDPTVKALEAEAAVRFGKEAAVFVPSGTMANQAAMMAWLRPGDEVLCEAASHVFNFEGGGMARLAGAQARQIPGVRGQMPIALLEETLAAIRPGNEHQPRTRLVAVENTHNLAGGAVLACDYLERVRALADERGLVVHLDGARIFNAAVATGTPLARYGALADSVSCCLSKGLSAPAGSLLLGPVAFIAEARRARKVLGGAMRQSGILAAAGRVALATMIERLADDHRRARALAAGLAELDWIDIDPGAVETNIVRFAIRGYPGGAHALQAALAARGVRTIAFSPTRMRMVTHKDVGDEHVAMALTAFRGETPAAA